VCLDIVYYRVIIMAHMYTTDEFDDWYESEHATSDDVEFDDDELDDEYTYSEWGVCG